MSFLIIWYIKITKYNESKKTLKNWKMYQYLKKNFQINKYLFLPSIAIFFLILVLVIDKNNTTVVKRSEINADSYQNNDSLTFKKFLFDQIRSPFLNIKHEIKNGDTIQKILSKYEIQKWYD